MGIADILPWRRWRSVADERLRRGSQILSTPRGTVEYVSHGSGVPLIVLHGTPGGYDQGDSLATLLGEDSGIQVISISRPGYLRTEASLGQTPRSQGDLVVAVMDALRIERAVVCGISGGAMAAIWCAADHPDRLGGLILLEGLIAAQDIRLRRYELAVLRSNVTGWLVEGWIGRIIRVLSAHRDIADSGRAAAIAMTRSSVPFPPRETGTLLDEAAALNFSAPELTRIAVPTLIVHGDRDRTVPSGPAIQAALTMPAARLIMVRGGNHHSTIPSETARASMHGFIRGSSARYFASE